MLMIKELLADIDSDNVETNVNEFTNGDFDFGEVLEFYTSSSKTDRSGNKKLRCKDGSYITSL